jgi:hypothetical protein
LHPKALNISPFWGDISFRLKDIINTALSRFGAHPITGLTPMESSNEDQEADDHNRPLDRRFRGQGRAFQQALTLPSILGGCRTASTPAAAPFF